MMPGGAAPCAHAPAAKTGAAAHEGAQQKSGQRDFAALLGAASGAPTESAAGSDQASSPEPRSRAETTAPRETSETQRAAHADAGTDAEIDADTDAGADVEADATADGDAQGSAVGAVDSAPAADAETPPLLNWLFGLMAATGSRGVPAVPAEVAAPPAHPRPMPQTAASLAGAQGAAGSPPGTAAALSLAQDADPTAVLADALVPADSADFSAEMLAATADSSSRQLPQQAAAMVLGVAEPRQAASAAPSQVATANALLSPLSPDFIPDLGEHIVWQLDQGVSEAKIELHPAELGALTVRIETRGDQASVHIVAAEAGTRAMLSQALPQLRELLSGSGLQLTRSHIESAGRRDERSGERGPEPHAEPGARRRVSRVVLVDAYA